jgi:MraZ protein
MFISSVINTLDAKGRVSVPSEFRSHVSSSAFDGVILYPSKHGAFLDGGGMSLFEGYQRSLEQMEPFDPGRVAIEHLIFGQSRSLSFDGGGRVTLPKDLAEHAGLNGKVKFVGLGNHFQIWSPEAHEVFLAEALELAVANQGRLKTVPPVAVPSMTAPSKSGAVL